MTRLEFLLAPLALLGLRKNPADVVEESETRWKVAARGNRVFCDHLHQVVEQQAKELKELRERTLSAEKDAVESREMRDNWEKVVNYRSKYNDYWCERAVAAEKELQALRKETA